MSFSFFKDKGDRWFLEYGKEHKTFLLCVCVCWSERDITNGELVIKIYWKKKKRDCNFCTNGDILLFLPKVVSVLCYWNEWSRSSHYLPSSLNKICTKVWQYPREPQDQEPQNHLEGAYSDYSRIYFLIWIIVSREMFQLLISKCKNWHGFNCIRSEFFKIRDLGGHN